MAAGPRAQRHHLHDLDLRSGRSGVDQVFLDLGTVDPASYGASMKTSHFFPATTATSCSAFLVTCRCASSCSKQAKRMREIEAS
ncbi:unnamed protein product [Urochloa humidicola]